MEPCDCVEASGIDVHRLPESVFHFELESRAEEIERRIHEIDSEFGDETENWFHKWNEGMRD